MWYHSGHCRDNSYAVANAIVNALSGSDGIEGLEAVAEEHYKTLWPATSAVACKVVMHNILIYCNTVYFNNIFSSTFQ